MNASDIVKALENGLITAHEALEQAQVDTVDALYERASYARQWSRGDSFMHMGRGLK